jgi:predicted transcriptional regulator
MSDASGETDNVLLKGQVDEVLDIMSKRHRRLILLLLKRGTIETTNDAIVRGGSERDGSNVQLTHNHLPKLEDAGYIEWDRETDEITKGPRFDEIEPLLELIEDHADELPHGWP